MSRWNHAICVDCFTTQQPRREPVTLRVVNMDTRERVRETHNCCFCGLRTDAGIFIRADPMETLCHGERVDSPVLIERPVVFTAHKEDDE